MAASSNSVRPQRFSPSKLWHWLNHTPYFAAIITSLYAGLLLVGILHHEIWRDEMQAWLVARDSASLGELLFQNLRYEGTPAFWYICLFFLTRLTHNPIAMQLANMGFMVGAIYLLTQFSPLSRLQKLLFIFGYFPLFEYGIISRNYASGLFFCFCFCLLYPLRHKQYFPLALGLAFLSQTSAYGLLISATFGVFLGIDFLWTHRQTLVQSLQAQFWDLSLSSTLMIASALTAGLTMLPPPDRGWGTEVTVWSTFKLLATPAILWNAFIPIPEPHYTFWNTNIVHLGSLTLTMLLRDIGGALIIGCIIIVLRRTPLILGLFLCGSLAIEAFTYVKWYGFMRHHGHLFLLFICCLWLAQYHLVQQTPSSLPHQKPGPVHPRIFPKLGKLPAWTENIQKNFVVGILGLHIVAGVFAYGIDLRFPFSDSQAAAQYIRNQLAIESATLVGHPDYLISPLAGYLDTRIYYPTVGEFGSFWQTNIYKKNPTQSELLDAVQTLLQQPPHSVLLILNQPLQPGGEPNQLEIKALEHFDRGFLWSNNYFWPLDPEHYFIYRVRTAP